MYEDGDDGSRVPGANISIPSLGTESNLTSVLDDNRTTCVSLSCLWFHELSTKSNSTITLAVHDPRCVNPLYFLPRELSTK